MLRSLLLGVLWFLILVRQGLGLDCFTSNLSTYLVPYAILGKLTNSSNLCARHVGIARIRGAIGLCRHGCCRCFLHQVAIVPGHVSHIVVKTGGSTYSRSSFSSSSVNTSSSFLPD